MLAGAVPHHRAAAITELPDEDEESDYEIVEFVDDDGTIAAVQFKSGTSKKYWLKKDSRGNQNTKFALKRTLKMVRKLTMAKLWL